jgi:hypothetical protein
MYMKTNDKYKISLSLAVPGETPNALPRAAGRKVAADSSTSQLQNSTNDPGMYMKTKEEVKKS